MLAALLFDAVINKFITTVTWAIGIKRFLLNRNLN
jgi:hypothetical protein